ncbi:hypothetical protein EON77_12595 [bacterium]|nr:MAG: hypothetical protein EON77_12595 [bacterium]
MKRVLLLLAALVGLASVAVAQERSDLAALLKKHEIASYKGLTGLNPVYASVDRDGALAKDTEILSDDEIRDLVLLRLRANRVKAYTPPDDSDQSPEGQKAQAEYSEAVMAYLDVTFNMLKTSDGLYVYNFTLEVREPCRLTRDPKIDLQTNLSKREILGYASRSRIREAMRSLITEKVDEICGMFLEANS